MSNQTQVRQPNAIQRFFRETIVELRKVSWPTRPEALALTRIVLIVMIVMAIILGGLDTVFGSFFRWLLY
ncbi:MAG: preprotein translocase subunit SecE [Anaerolineales bacterium]|nr:preprotein translocase subunit SecE [Anaerolineales bacterium]MBX3006380.1 preprotein translocase subunit SecE [Anaerolineales bacterium]